MNKASFLKEFKKFQYRVLKGKSEYENIPYMERVFTDLLEIKKSRCYIIDRFIDAIEEMDTEELYLSEAFNKVIADAIVIDSQYVLNDDETDYLLNNIYIDSSGFNIDTKGRKLIEKAHKLLKAKGWDLSYFKHY